MHYVYAFVGGFCLGMIPWSYIIARLKGIDLRTLGSGNIGATNLGRALGPPYFVLGFILDGCKGLVPVILAKHFSYPAACVGTGALIGHIFNPLFGLRGGKGVSTTIGVALGLVPQSFLISLPVWILVYVLTYIVSLASLLFALVLPLVAIGISEAQVLDRLFVVGMALCIVFAHRSNIKRLLTKKEPKTILWRT